MKKFFFIIIISVTLNKIVYGYSKSFEYMTSVMNIELKTEHGYELNEEIYNKYNQFVYGNPLIIHSGQRWKDVEDGRWTKGGGAWNGVGTRGEYWVLGYNLSEEYVHNHKFPVDIEPPTPPTQWRYVLLPDALSSWSDSKLYLHEEQKEYMQTTKLMRNNITYDLTAIDIGLNKARLENYATWKTSGNIYTRRYDINNNEWAANFIVPPIAADASLVSSLYLPNGNTYSIDKDESSLLIPVEFGCQTINLTSYAKAEHVKKIYSEVSINDRTMDSIEKEKSTDIFKSTYIVINKSDYPNQASVELEICCNSMLLTEFFVDGALTDSKAQVIKINIEGAENITNELYVKNENKTYDKNAIPPHIDSVDLGREENGKFVNLKTSKKTNSKFICAGQVLAIQVETKNTDYITLEFSGNASIATLDDLTKKFEWDDPRSRGVSTRFTTLKKLQESYGGKTKVKPYKTVEEKSYFKYFYVIPYKTEQTLHSWSTLREISNDAFNIDESKLFNRIIDPYYVVIKAYSSDGVRTKRVALDVFERWDTLYNRDLKPYVK